MLIFLLSLSILAVASWIDIKKSIIPHWLNFSGIFLAILIHLWNGEVIHALLSGACIFIFTVLLILLIGDGIGGGDIWLMTFIGIAFGLPISNFIIMGAFLLAIIKVVITKRKEIQFAPFVLASFLLCIPLIMR
ncbi:hypothetical protein EEL30_00690 (plasmid) [Brevibacillus laterosporus]|uniref:Prepilin type IV endopeptidase peptidase domain-containing protein n=1 Tax=Brevibacillus laterosporus TaxID=1465 RepID=A0A518V207_BRELA|nr:hypothetical protein EEL30_00690 [Brevibacillus laterosporus]